MGTTKAPFFIELNFRGLILVWGFQKKKYFPILSSQKLPMFKISCFRQPIQLMASINLNQILASLSLDQSQIILNRSFLDSILMTLLESLNLKQDMNQISPQIQINSVSPPDQTQKLVSCSRMAQHHSFNTSATQISTQEYAQMLCINAKVYFNKIYLSKFWCVKEILLQNLFKLDLVKLHNNKVSIMYFVIF